MDVQNIACLGSDKKRQIGELRTIPFDATGPVFIVTCHGVLFLGPEVTFDEAQGVFSSYWDRHNQVNVGMFHDDREFYKNIGHVVNYSLKHDCRMEFRDGFLYPWDREWIVSYYAWIEAYSRGFQSLRTCIGSKGRKNVSVKEGNASDLNGNNQSEDHFEDDNECEESGAAVLSENDATI